MYKVGDTVRHIRTGRVYVIVLVAKSVVDQSLQYIYRSLGNPSETPWVRSAAQMEDGRFEVHAL